MQMNKVVIFYAGMVKVLVNKKLVKLHYEFQGDRQHYTDNNYKVIIRR